ncbi:hypothetical protein CEXT_373881 [Caerostris extrusa]|uniref:Secreted protein n=1 Tax=Caerostris extrusa TaxID=172846 RepID=A0AAV4MVW6_CAEEX|nr:hypothetical protein CEXT_373881 [Caerostris extrusa]
MVRFSLSLSITIIILRMYKRLTATVRVPGDLPKTVNGPQKRDQLPEIQTHTFSDYSTARPKIKSLLKKHSLTNLRYAWNSGGSKSKKRE